MWLREIEMTWLVFPSTANMIFVYLFVKANFVNEMPPTSAFNKKIKIYLVKKLSLN